MSDYDRCIDHDWHSGETSDLRVNNVCMNADICDAVCYCHWLDDEGPMDASNWVVEPDCPTHGPASDTALRALEFIRDFTWRKVLCWQGFNGPEEVQANTDLLQIWQLLTEIAPDASNAKDRDERANAIGERIRNGEFKQMRAALASTGAARCDNADTDCEIDPQIGVISCVIHGGVFAPEASDD